MSAAETQNGDPSGVSPSSASQAGSHAPGQNSSEQPRCYNCGLEGHYVMGCPEPTRAIPAGLAAARAAGASHPGKREHGPNDGRSFHHGQSSNRQRSGVVVTRYPVPKSAPVITRYAVPPHVMGGYGASQGPYQQPYQQYDAQFAQSAGYQGNRGPTPGASYGPYPPAQQYAAAPQYSYSQANAPQPAGNPSMAGPPYGNQGYPPHPSYSQYQQHGPQPYQNPPQPYANQPAMGPYPTLGNHYQPPNSNYGGGYGYNSQTNSQFQGPHSQWSHQPPAQYQHPTNLPHGPSYQGQYPSTYQAYTPLPHQLSQQGPPYSTYGSAQEFPVPPQQSQTSSSVPPERSKSVDSSASSSGGHDHSGNNLHSKGRGGSAGGHHGWKRHSTDLQSEHPDSFDTFDWELEMIFNEDTHSPAVPINKTLSNNFTDPPSYLGFENADTIVSQFVTRENLEEFKLSIRDTLHWSTAKNDPAFAELSSAPNLIPFDEVRSWMEDRHTTRSRIGSPADRGEIVNEDLERRDRPEANGVKRPRSPEMQLEKSSPKRVKAEQDYNPAGDGKECEEESSPRIHRSDTSPEIWPSATPVPHRSVTPSLGTEDDAWAPQPGEGLISQPVTKDPTEALLASLGVSGEPKPVRDTTGNNPDIYDKPPGYPPQRQDSGYFSSRGSYSNGSSSDSYNNRRSLQWEGPPPPPPPRDFLKRLDGAGDTTEVMQSPLEAMQRPRNPSRTTSRDSDMKDNSQSQKRGDGKKPEPVRQEDDGPPRYKRPQPQVAEAYSRRW